jgi:hypothetical protein
MEIDLTSPHDLAKLARLAEHYAKNMTSTRWQHAFQALADAADTLEAFYVKQSISGPLPMIQPTNGTKETNGELPPHH